MSSGVRNLRAMFENQKGASSPEPRGRSPGDNTTTAEDEPARPTPKVRASFISVVPPTAIAPPDLGTAKVMPTNSTASHRRESFSVSQDNPEEIAELKKEVSDIREERRKSSAIVETVPERAVASRESSRGPPPLRDEPAGDIAGDIREETAQELHDEAVEDEAVEDLPEEPAADMANLGSIMKGSDFPEPAAAEAEKTPAQETPAQTPVQKETESAVVAKDDAPAQSQAPAKTEEKAAPAPKADAPALTPAEKEQKSVEAAKADAPTPSQTPAEPEEKPAVAPEAEASAQPGLLVEDKKETVVAASDDAPKLPSGTVEKPIVAPTDDTIALDETPTKAEPVPEPAAAPVEEAPVATETPTQSEEKTATPVNDAPVASATPAQTEGETSATEPVETPADNPDKVVTGVQEEVSMKPADLTDAATVSGGQALPPPVEALPVSSTPKAAAATPKPTESKAKTNGTPATKTKPEIKKPAAISTAKASTSRAAANKSPLPRAAPKTPTKPTTGASAAKPSPAASRVKPAVTKPTTAKAEVKPTVAKEPAKTAASTTAKEPTKAAAPKTSRASIRPGGLPTATASTTSAATKAKAAAPENKKPAAAKPAAPGSTSSASSSGFKKPTPKSPTRPVRLPSHLIAPTAASAAKHGEEPKVTRKPSTTTRPKAAAPGAKPARTSLAPATTAPKRPDSRASTTSTAPKGDFLSRMMRPTAASANKLHDKPASPPHKGTKAPVSAIQKGKKKVEEVAAKAKDALTTNGDHAEESTANDSSIHEEAAESHEPEPTKVESVAPQEQVEVAPSAHEANASGAEGQSAQVAT